MAIPPMSSLHQAATPPAPVPAPAETRAMSDPATTATLLAELAEHTQESNKQYAANHAAAEAQRALNTLELNKMFADLPTLKPAPALPINKPINADTVSASNPSASIDTVLSELAKQMRESNKQFAANHAAAEA